MKTILAIFLLVPIQAFSMTPTEFKKEYEEIFAKQSDKIQQCKKQNDEVLSKASTEIKKSNGDIDYDFIKDEKKALELMNSLNLDQLMSASYDEAEVLLINNCSPENIKVYTTLGQHKYICELNILNELAFMKGLINAQKNYNWSKETKDKAHKTILAYLNKSASIPRPINNQDLAIHLLQKMVEYGQIDKKFSKEINKIKSVSLAVLFPPNKSKKEIAKIEKARATNPCYHTANMKKKMETSEKIRIDLKNLLEKIAS